MESHLYVIGKTRQQSIVILYNLLIIVYACRDVGCSHLIACHGCSTSDLA